MASTYSSNLALELVATGEQSGTWGTTTNTNLGTLIEQAISGYVTQAITDGADTTITIPNGATGVARNMTLELTGALTGARNLIVPANKKLYFVYNNTTGGQAVTVKVTGQTGVAVPAGKKVALVSNGTDIVESINQVVGTLTVGGLVATTADINGGTIDGTTQATGTINGALAVGGSWTAAATWTLPALTLGGTVTSNGQSFSGTIANLGTVTTVDINGGSIDGTAIGGFAASTVAATTITTTGDAAFGAALLEGTRLRLGGTSSGGVTQRGALSSWTATSAATTAISGYESFITTPNETFTTPIVRLFYSSGVTKGGSHTITVLAGLDIADLSAGATNYGIRSAVSSGASKWNIYASGTADNAFAGNVRIGSTTAPTVALDVTGTLTTTKATAGQIARFDTSAVTGETYIAVGYPSTDTRLDLGYVVDTGNCFINSQFTNSALGIRINNTEVGAFSISGEAYFKFSSARNGAILVDTSDASDNRALYLCAGGAISNSRGAMINMFGNEHSGTGKMQIYAGNVTGGDIEFYNAGLEWVMSRTAGSSRIASGVRIGADSSNNLLDDASNGAGTATLYIGNASINVTSDERIKTNVREWDGDASAILKALPVKAWDNYLSDAPQGGYEGGYVGFTAQDMHKVAPWSVNTQGDTGLPWQARYEFLNGIIVKGWQEHEQKIADLTTRLAAAEQALAALQ